MSYYFSSDLVEREYDLAHRPFGLNVADAVFTEALAALVVIPPQDRVRVLTLTRLARLRHLLHETGAFVVFLDCKAHGGPSAFQRARQRHHGSSGRRTIHLLKRDRKSVG